MMKILFVVMAVLVFALPVFGQIPGWIDVPDYYRQGKVMHAAGVDTFHFEDTQVAEVADWQGYETVYVPWNGSMIDKRAYVIGAVLQAKSPFDYYTTYRNGDADAVTAVTDTTIQQAMIGNYTILRPCVAVVRGDLDEIRAVSASGDTVFCFPLLDWDVSD